MENDPITELQQCIIDMSTTMYNAIGIIQRDSAPLPFKTALEGHENLQDVKTKAVEDLIHTSNRFDELVIQFEGSVQNEQVLKGNFEGLLRMIPEKIENQKRRISDLEGKLSKLESQYDGLVKMSHQRSL